jgi:hypothetical protein
MVPPIAAAGGEPEPLDKLADKLRTLLAKEKVLGVWCVSGDIVDPFYLAVITSKDGKFFYSRLYRNGRKLTPDQETVTPI